MDKEVKYGPVLTGRVDPAKAVTNAGARPGDCLMLTKPIGVGIINTAIKRGGADAAIVEGFQVFVNAFQKFVARLNMVHHIAHIMIAVTY